jgi:hypothetical protein
MSITSAIVIFAGLSARLGRGRIPGPVIKFIALGLLALSFVAFFIVVQDSSIFSRWTHRSFGASRDVTFWTRVAAVIGQIQTLGGNPVSWLLGRGFGSTYSWPNNLFPWILPYLGPDTKASAWFPGEFMWMPLVFYGGCLAGGVAAVILLALLFRSYSLLRGFFRKNEWSQPAVYAVSICALSYISFIGMGFTSNPMGSRLAAEFMGACAGVIAAQGGGRKT